MPVFARRPVEPMCDQILARGSEEYGIGSADRLDGYHPPALVDRQPEFQQRFFLAQKLSCRVGRLEFRRRSEQPGTELQGGSLGGVTASGITAVPTPVKIPGSTVRGPGS